MKNLHLVPAGCVLSLAAAACGAQTIKPGLWEMSTRMAGGSGDMEKLMAESQKHMDAMPPEQRKKMAEMMAKQGINMGTPGSGMSVKICMTKEMIERNEVTRQEGNCKQTGAQRTGNTMTFSVACTKPPSTGEGQVTFSSPEAYTTKMTIHTTRQGKPETMKMESAGKFLSADCGSIKPMAVPAK
jgi:hypothetical protein